MADNPTYQLGLEGQNINSVLSRASIGGAIDQNISNVEKANTLYTFYRDSNSVVINPHTSSNDGFITGDDEMSVKCKFSGYVYIACTCWYTMGSGQGQSSFVYTLSKKSTGGSYSAVETRSYVGSSATNISPNDMVCLAVSSGDTIKVSYGGGGSNTTIDKIKLFCMKIG